jgi:hypothetical protein
MTVGEMAITATNKATLLEQVIINGDLSKLQPAERVNYYRTVCESIGVNPFTKPFEYIMLNGKLTLYAKKDCTDQVRDNNAVSIVKLERERMDGVYVVTAYAQDKDGRMDSSIGVTNIENLKGDALANAMMKAETKAKRRVTLSICGLGMLDETEIETIPPSVVKVVDIQDTPKPQPTGQPVPEFHDYAWACTIKTKQGALLVDLKDDQLTQVVEESKFAELREAAGKIIDHRIAEMANQPTLGV